MKSLKDLFWMVFDSLTYFWMTEGGQRREKERWKKEAFRRGATNVVVRWDSFEMESIPYYVMPGEELDAVCTRIRVSGAHSIGDVITIKP